MRQLSGHYAKIWRVLWRKPTRRIKWAITLGVSSSSFDDDKGNTNSPAINEEIAPIRRNIFRSRQQENRLQEVAGKLRHQGITTPRGGRWHASSVQAVLDKKDQYRGGGGQRRLCTGRGR